MKETILWIDAIYEDVVELDFHNIIKFSYHWKTHSPGRFISNKGGWQSNDCLKSAFRCEEIDKFIKILGEKFEDHYISDMWININGIDCFNEIHDHIGGPDLSGVLYINANPDMGNIVFSKTFNRKPMSKENREKYIVEYPANTGTMYVFSSSIPHFVKKNNIEQDRVSISFNLSLK